MDTQKFNIGDKVKHKTTDEFEMVIVDFDVYWNNDRYKQVNNVKNPEYPICKYYNKHTNLWEQNRFHSCELVLCE
jgi:Hemimethylated DNA-binding protein YccV like.